MAPCRRFTLQAAMPAIDNYEFDEPDVNYWKILQNMPLRSPEFAALRGDLA
jgi:hypothetical protein